MNQSIVSRGRTIKDAVDTGLDILGVSKSDVDIEIINDGSKKFWGLGKTSAVVKLTRIVDKVSSNDHDTPDKAYMQIEKEIDSWKEEKLNPNINNGGIIGSIEEVASVERTGKAWVTDGKIYCRSTPHHFPTLSFSKGMKLYKNSQLINEKTTIIAETDQLEVELETSVKETKWAVTIVENGLRAILKVEPGYTMIRSLQDAEPSEHLKLSFSEDVIHQNSLTYEDIIEQLNKHRITYGINQSEILMAQETMIPETFEIATGKPAVEGENGWVDYRVDLETNGLPVNREDGSINFREINTIPNVTQGQVIAVIHPAKVGETGTKVTNEPLPPKPVFDLKLSSCKGIMPIENDSLINIVANESGRPFIQKRGQRLSITIMPKLFHKGDVNLEFGNIRFHGDVEVAGEVNEKMEVEAKGNVIIHKNVYKANITSIGSTMIKGHVIGSNLSAGKSNMLITELGSVLEEISKQINSMVYVIKLLMESPAFKSSDFPKTGLQPLVRILLDKKFNGLPLLIKKYIEKVEHNKKFLDYEWIEVCETLKTYFVVVSSIYLTREKIIELLTLIETLVSQSKTSPEPNAYITIPYAMNSKLYCSGDITVAGQGCYNSKIYSGGHTRITGVLRGGELFSKMGVEVGETSSEVGVPTIISVPIDRRILIKTANEGTVIKIGNLKYTFTESRTHINAYVYENKLYL